MPDHANRKILSLAGAELPAVHQTLNHLLATTENPDSDLASIVSAIELDPAILASFLHQYGCDSLGEWTRERSVAEVRGTALTLANHFVLADLTDAAAEFHLDLWQKSLIQGALGAGIARKIGLNPRQYRLLGLLAGIGHHVLARSHGASYLEVAAASEPVSLAAREVAAFGISGADLGATLLRRWGCSAADADCLRYQYADLDALQDSSRGVALIALAGQMIHYIRFDEQAAPGLPEAAKEMLGIEADVMSDLVAQANETWQRTEKQINVRQDPIRQFSVNLAKANLVEGIWRSSNSGMGQLQHVAKLLFGAEPSVLLLENSGQLHTTLASGESLSVAAASGKSLIARSFLAQQPDKISTASLASIFDRQLAERLGSELLWLLPLEGAGILVAGLEVDELMPPHLVRAFQLSATAYIQAAQGPDKPMIEAEYVRKKVSEVTHEVNNPLAIVQNYLRTLSIKLADNSPVQADIETIANEMIRISGIVQKYAQIGRQEDLLTEEVDLNQILTELTGVFKGGQERVQFTLDLDYSMPFVSITPDSFKQVTVNLLKNAVEALKGKTDGCISVTTNGTVNLGGTPYVEVLIDDNGPGIPQAVQKRLFQPNNAKGGDRGLGLNIVRQLVEDMGGLISCRSQVGEGRRGGTNFQILIPVPGQKEFS